MQVGRKRKVGRDCETVTVNESVGQVETAVGVVILGCGYDCEFCADSQECAASILRKWRSCLSATTIRCSMMMIVHNASCLSGC
ncbi:hypothetical protein L1887_53812 [Cichorium endivia]|nr:hypothetical protein L1887_53812 [Cichorium endivia]